MTWSSLLTGEYPPPPPPPLLERLAGRVPLVNSLVLPCKIWWENVDDYKEKVEMMAGTVTLCTDIRRYLQWWWCCCVFVLLSRNRNHFWNDGSEELNTSGLGVIWRTFHHLRESLNNERKDEMKLVKSRYKIPLTSLAGDQVRTVVR